MAGRPTALTPELEASILEHLRDGMSDTDTCALVGISYGAFKDWMQRGLGTSKRRKSEAIFVTFAANVQAARVQCKARWIKSIDAAAKDDWKAHKFLLAVRHPEEFSERVISGKRLLAAIAEAKQAALAGRPADGSETAQLTEIEVKMLEALTRYGGG